MHFLIFIYLLTRSLSSALWCRFIRSRYLISVLCKWRDIDQGLIGHAWRKMLRNQIEDLGYDADNRCLDPQHDVLLCLFLWAKLSHTQTFHNLYLAYSKHCWWTCTRGSCWSLLLYQTLPFPSLWQYLICNTSKPAFTL